MRSPKSFITGFILGSLFATFFIFSFFYLEPVKDRDLWTFFDNFQSPLEKKHEADSFLATKKASPDEVSKILAGEELIAGKEAVPGDIGDKEEQEDLKVSAKTIEVLDHPSVAKLVPVSSLGHKENMFFSSEPHNFSLCKLGTGSGPTLMIVGGIQGDEPGGFSAASLISTHYTINKGSVWVVPDLNYAAILRRSRGLAGDMNRKFAYLDKNDPEYELVRGIQSILLHEKVDLILNLHDGSGFYRPKYESPLRNPHRWGQSVIIDQKEMDAPRFNKLLLMADKAKDEVNQYLLDPEHKYFIRNTETYLGDVEMERSLSYFAVLNGKPAFGVEASKEFTTEFRSYYHILVVESFMRQMGIEFTRDFSMDPPGVLNALNSNLNLSLYGGKVVLPLDNIRPSINFLPMDKDKDPEVKATRPLLSLVCERGDWRVAYGNRTLTQIYPEYLSFDNSLDSLAVEVDGHKRLIRMGEMVSVKNYFIVDDLADYRVNAIGAVKEVNGTEAGVKLIFNDFMPRFSVDKNARIFRVEVYKDEAFCGLFLVNFGQNHSPEVFTFPFTAVKGEESSFGY